MKKPVKIALIALVGLIVLGTIVGQLLKVTPVHTAVLEKTALVSAFRENGVVQTGNLLKVYVPFDGKIGSIVGEAERVTAGQRLLKMDTTDLSYQRSQLQAQLSAVYGQKQMQNQSVSQSQKNNTAIARDMARANVDKMALEAQRTATLYDEGAVSLAELEAVRKALADAQRELAIRENDVVGINQSKASSDAYYNAQATGLKSQLGQVQSKLNEAEVVAPVDGIATKVAASPGGGFSSAAPVLELQTSARLVAKTDVLAEDAAVLRMGQPATVLQKTRDSELRHKGTIARIDPVAHEAVSSLGLTERRVRVEIDLDRQEALFPGYDVTIEFETYRKDGVLTVAKNTCFEADKKTWVWLVKSNRLVRQEVKIGAKADYTVEIVKGLKEGDVVVVDPNNSAYKEGLKVKPDHTGAAGGKGAKS